MPDQPTDPLRDVPSHLLPFRVTTRSGAQADVVFPLHPETGSRRDVARLLTALLDTLDRKVEGTDQVSNGDVLQAVAMALAVRAGMIPAPPVITRRLAQDLLAAAATAMETGRRSQPGPVGNA